MKEITRIEFNDEEEKALQTLARISCEEAHMSCCTCPFARQDADTFAFIGCLQVDIRDICRKYGIKFEQ